MKFAMGIDRINSYSSDIALLNECINIVKSKGHTVESAGRGPSATQNYCRSHTVDVMVQVAGGMCIGSLSDFCYGIKQGYYHAKKCNIPIYCKGWTKYDPMTYKPGKGAWDDNFSYKLPKEWFSQFLNQTFPEVYQKFQQYIMLPYSPGTSAQEMMTKMLSGSSGSTTTSASTGTGEGGGGTTAFDLIKQVVSPWDKYGVTMTLKGDTLTVGRESTSNAPILNEDMIVLDSINLSDYRADSVNYITDGANTIKDDFLINRFGKIEPDEKPEKKNKAWLQDMYQVAQRDCGHTIDLKVLFDPKLEDGKYVHLKLPSFGLDGYYFVSKTSVEEENCMNITLDPAPPSRYQEPMKAAETTDTSGNGLGKDMISIGNALAAKYKFANKINMHDPGEYYKGCETYSCMKEKGNGSCFAWAEALYTELNAVGIKTRIIQYAVSGGAGNHRSVQVNTNGSWEDYPYKKTNISKYAGAYAKSGMFVVKNPP